MFFFCRKHSAKKAYIKQLNIGSTYRFIIKFAVKNQYWSISTFKTKLIQKHCVNDKTNPF